MKIKWIKLKVDDSLKAVLMDVEGQHHLDLLGVVQGGDVLLIVEHTKAL